MHETVQECVKGQHDLKVICKAGSEERTQVVNWCSGCGCVVIDLEEDGELITAGGVLPMMASRLFYDTVQESEKEESKIIT